MLNTTLNVNSIGGAIKLPYMANAYAYSRRKTREVMVGDVGVGGDNPIRVQSMTTTLTKDVDATVAQTLRLVDGGLRDRADHRAHVRTRRRSARSSGGCGRRGIDVPLVADIHFSPAAAMEAAHHVEKVRINPGNFADAQAVRRPRVHRPGVRSELERIEERFTPLVLKCKALGVAMRVGTNHGSLSDRIMNRFGDTPLGMVESALEFLRICEQERLSTTSSSR